MDIYRAMVEQCDIIFFCISADGIIISSNQYTMELLKMPYIKGTNLYSFFDEGSSLRIKANLSSNLKDTIDVNLLSLDGAVIKANISINSKDGSIFIFGMPKVWGNGDAFKHRQSSGEGIIIKSTAGSMSSTEESNDKREWQVNNIDPLTGLFNKDFFKRVFERHLKTAEQVRENVGIVLIDIDDFGLINTRYGRLRGDSILSGFSQVIYSYIRSTDFAVRYEGDCFLLLLINIKSKVLSLIAERIRENVQKKLGVSISAGCTCTDSAKTMVGEELIKIAFNALSTSKSQGKDRITAI